MTTLWWPAVVVVEAFHLGMSGLLAVVAVAVKCCRGVLWLLPLHTALASAAVAVPVAQVVSALYLEFLPLAVAEAKEVF